ncbi:MAG: hypothetical protein C5B43_00555, partial [Verrucomicrobia bacterium]
SDLNKGIDLSNRAMQILQQAGPTRESALKLAETVAEYKKAVKNRIKAQEKDEELLKALQNLSSDFMVQVQQIGLFLFKAYNTRDKH